jgi:hypothetical protein
MNSHLWRVPVLALVMLLASCSGKNKDESGEMSDEPEASTTTGVDADGGQQKQVKNLGALVDLIVAEAAAIPRAEFDPTALAKQLGKDPKAHFEWVRDHTWWAPYRGLLRGSKGVMLDRVGSNLDRAVLLGDLLRRSGHTVRLAHTQLPDVLARDLLGKVRPIPDQRRKPPAPKHESTERQGKIEAILPGHEQSMLQQIADAKKASDEADTLIRSQAGLLFAAVREIATTHVAGDRTASTALQDHWWVEREENGKWIAMDVLLPDARIGNTIATASDRSDWKSADELPQVPESEWHAVQISVVVERYEADTTIESTILETTLRPAVVFDRPVTLSHMPKPWPDSIADPKTDPNALGNAAVNVREWIPFLRVGDELVVQSAFTEGGNLKANPLSAASDISEVGGGGFMVGFGEALGGGETASSSITAEWIDYEIRIPGEASQQLRRPIFDLLGPANRAAKASGFDASTNDRLVVRYEALLSSTDILLLPCEFTRLFVTHLQSEGIVNNQAAIKELSLERDHEKAKDLASTILRRIDMWGPLPELAFLRSTLGKEPKDWFINQPNILNYRIGRPVVNGDRVAFRQMIDIASNVTGVRQGASRGMFEVRLHQGVVDTVAEMLALGSTLRMTENTASIFAMSETGPDYGMVIGPRDAEALQDLNWPDDVAARLADNIGAGFVAVAIKAPVLLNGSRRIGWWRVDPASGATVGVMDTGFHAADEDAILRTQRQRLAEWLYDSKNWKDYQTLRRMARDNSRQMSSKDVFDYNMYSLVERTITDLLYVSWI